MTHLPKTCLAAATSIFLLWAKPVCAQMQFTDVTSSAGVANSMPNASRVATSATWGDYDGDGDLDLYVTNWAANANASVNRLYRNNGNGTFSEVGFSAAVDHLGDSEDAAWGDYDGDGDLDLYVVNREQSNALYKNDGTGRFTEVACEASIDNTDIGHAARWVDYDGDSDLDLAVVNVGGNALYRNDGDDVFTNVATGDLAGTATTWIGWASAWADFDGDNDFDVLLVNGANSSAGQVSQILLQTSGTFTDETAAAGLSIGGSYGIDAAVGDFDGDGDLDIYLVNSQFPSFEASILYRNDTP